MLKSKPGRPVKLRILPARRTRNSRAGEIDSGGTLSVSLVRWTCNRKLYPSIVALPWAALGWGCFRSNLRNRIDLRRDRISVTQVFDLRFILETLGMTAMGIRLYV